MTNEHGVTEVIGDRIKQLRQAKGLSLRQFGRQIGYTASSVLKWETGDTANMRNETLLLVCAVLGTDPYYLVFGPERGKSVLRTSTEVRPS